MSLLHRHCATHAQVENPAELDELLDEAAYKEHCENEDH